MDKQKICFFKHNDSNEYFVRIYSEKNAKMTADRVNHRNGHEESGFRHFDCEVVLMLDVPDDIYCKIDKVAHFIINKFGVKTREDSFLAECGWYEFKDIANADKWFTDYHTFQKENNRTTSTFQTTLF